MTPAIIIKFLRRDLPEELYSTRKQLRGKTTRGLGLVCYTVRKIICHILIGKKTKFPKLLAKTVKIMVSLGLGLRLGLNNL